MPSRNGCFLLGKPYVIGTHHCTAASAWHRLQRAAPMPTSAADASIAIRNRTRRWRLLRRVRAGVQVRAVRLGAMEPTRHALRRDCSSSIIGRRPQKGECGRVCRVAAWFAGGIPMGIVPPFDFSAAAVVRRDRSDRRVVLDTACRQLSIGSSNWVPGPAPSLICRVPTEPGRVPGRRDRTLTPLARSRQLNSRLPKPGGAGDAVRPASELKALGSAGAGRLRHRFSAARSRISCRRHREEIDGVRIQSDTIRHHRVLIEAR